MASRPCPCAVWKGQIPQKPAMRHNHLERNGAFTNPASLPSQLITNPVPSQPTLERRSPALSDNGGDPFYGYPTFPSVHLAAFRNREDDDPGSDSDNLSLHSYHKSDSTCSRSASPEDEMPLTSDYDEDSEMEDGNDLEIQVLEDAPDYISRERLFADTDSDEEDCLVDDNLELPPAFSEHRSLRNAYIHVFANATFHGATHVQSQIHLTSVHSALSSAQVPVDLSAFARTLATVGRHLGVNVDDTIIYFFVCPECWKRHHPSELKEPDFSSTCTRDNCSGQLEIGEMMRVYAYAQKEQVNATLLMVAADGPTRLKFSGFVSSNSEVNMCTTCKKPFSSLVDADCDDPETATTSDPDYADEIAAKKGVRAAPVDKIPGWRPALSSPSEIMHMIYLRLASGIHKDILLGGGMFNSGHNMEETPLQRFDDFLESMWWPADVGRVHSRLGTGGGKVKADEWRNAMLVYPVALFQAWQVGDIIPDGDAPLPKKRSKVKAAQEHTTELMQRRRKKNAARQADTTDVDYVAIEATGASRNYQDHYLNVLRYCTASRIIVTRAISPSDATRGRTFLSEAFSSWARMNCLLTPNFHFTTHTDLFLWAFGPAYAWWVFPFERHLGRLGRFKTNGHSGGELEATMMRSWWKSIYCQDLISTLQNQADRTPEDDLVIELLLKGMKGSGENQRARGTLSAHLAAMAAEAATASTVTLPKQSRSLDLRAENINSAPLCTQDMAPEDHYGVILSSKTKAFGNVQLRGVKIQYLLEIQLSSGETKLVALVERFEGPNPANEVWKDGVKAVPWHDWSVDLGISLWDTRTEQLEAVAMEDLSGRF
ncbi:hypothetical protein DFH07DRAFT_777994 [Mycena maculata]|uniref:Uncharacterized protein n=1 Tax=Mycena maculata TaxID=230809 RepID=A0AAD7IHH2_9AGAR|nr:hypothetical protein DFH07DRAFT_777994 [Mycena maculata]